MAKKTHIDVMVSLESIRDRLRKMLVTEHSQLIADVIMGNLSVTEVGQEQLFQAMSGVKQVFKYKVGDHVLSQTSPLYTWKFEKEEMTAAGLMIQGRVKCQVVAILPYNTHPYEVKYKALKGGLEEECKAVVKEEHICTEEEWPENLREEEELPF